MCACTFTFEKICLCAVCLWEVHQGTILCLWFVFIAVFQNILSCILWDRHHRYVCDTQKCWLACWQLTIFWDTALCNLHLSFVRWRDLLLFLSVCGKGVKIHSIVILLCQIDALRLSINFNYYCACQGIGFLKLIRWQNDFLLQSKSRGENSVKRSTAAQVRDVFSASHWMCSLCVMRRAIDLCCF